MTRRHGTPKAAPLSMRRQAGGIDIITARQVFRLPRRRHQCASAMRESPSAFDGLARRRYDARGHFSAQPPKHFSIASAGQTSRAG